MATTLAQLLTDVYDITKRPDLVAETKLAIKMATQKAHTSDYYPRDLEESGFSWNTPAFVQSFEYKKVFPFFRSLSYLRKYAAEGNGDFFEVITPQHVLDSYKRNRTNVCYQAGRMIEIRSSTQDASLLIGYYRFPDTTEASYSSWIADDFPHVIQIEAASVIFKMIGFDEQAAMFNKLTEQNMRELQSNSLQLGGY